jgi:hypothetical protein
MKMLGFPALDCLPSIDVSTEKGGACAFRNEPRSISASFVQPSTPKACSPLALMHDMPMQQHY